MKYCYKNPTEVVFTDDVFSEIETYISKFRASKLLIVSGVSFSSKIADNLSMQLQNKYEVLSFTGVSTNPTQETVYDAVRKSKQFSPDLIITVGGGSCHDCGKAISILLKNNESDDLNDYTVTGTLSVPGIKSSLPVITVPTIVGSGAEVSPAALIRINNEKKVIFSPLLHPVSTIINTAYMQSLTTSKIARSSFDSFIQSLEGYISNFANPIANSFALASINNYVECLPDLKTDSIDKRTIEKLAVASFFSSYVCSVAGVGAIHALSDPISGRYNVHHADALAIVAIEVLKYNLKATNADLKVLGKSLGIEYSEKEKLVGDIIMFTQKLIEDFSIGKERIAIDNLSLIEMVPECNNPDMAGNPYEFSEEEIKDILTKSLMN